MSIIPPDETAVWFATVVNSTVANLKDIICIPNVNETLA